MEEIYLKPQELTPEQLTYLRSLYDTRLNLHKAALNSNHAAIARHRRALARLDRGRETNGISHSQQQRVYSAAVSGISFESLSFE